MERLGQNTGFFQGSRAAGELRREAQGVVAGGEGGGDDEDELRGLVHADGAGWDFRLRVVRGDERDAHRGVVARHLDVPAREGEVGARRGAEVGRAGGGVEAGGEVEGGAFLADDVDGGRADGLAHLLALLEVDVDGVDRGVPRRAAHDALALGRRLEEAVVHPHPVEEEFHHDAVLQVEHVAQRLALQAGVDGHHLGDDALLVRRALRHDVEDLVVRIVFRHGVVRDLHVDLILNLVCHNVNY